MNSREIILANIAHTNPPRCGMTFDGGRIDDFEWCGLTAHGLRAAAVDGRPAGILRR